MDMLGEAVDLEPRTDLRHQIILLPKSVRLERFG